jgi:hypothetical protein
MAKSDRKCLRQRAIATLLGISLWATASAPAVAEPAQAGSAGYLFNIIRNGSNIGQHTVTIARQGEELAVRCITKLRVTFLSLTVYRFSYDSKSLWRDGRLQQLTAVTDDDGTVSTVKAEISEDGGRIEGPQGSLAAPTGIFPTDHWNTGVLNQSQVLNTITGQLNKVKIVDHGVETIEAEGKQIRARHYAYTGDLDANVWYDDAGRWVRLRFKGRDGSTIDYVCQRCLSVPVESYKK